MKTDDHYSGAGKKASSLYSRRTPVRCVSVTQPNKVIIRHRSADRALPTPQTCASWFLNALCVSETALCAMGNALCVTENALYTVKNIFAQRAYCFPGDTNTFCMIKTSLIRVENAPDITELRFP